MVHHPLSLCCNDFITERDGVLYCDCCHKVTTVDPYDQDFVHKYNYCKEDFVNVTFTDIDGFVHDRLVCPECVSHVQGMPDVVHDCKNTYNVKDSVGKYLYSGQCCCYSCKHGLRE